MTSEFRLNFLEKEVATINNRAAVIVSCWLAVTVISSVYIWITLSERILGDYLFGLIIPVGLLILVALAVTFGLPTGEGLSEKETILESTLSNGMKEINSKIDSLTKEVNAIKKTIEE